MTLPNPVPPAPLVVWCNLPLQPRLRDALATGLGQHQVLWATNIAPTNLFTGRPDPALADADIAFGQPEASQCAELARLRWVHLSSAGYAPFDPPAVRSAFAARSAALSNSSSVFAEPCAQHLLAFLLSQGRLLPQALANQLGPHGWPKAAMRTGSRLLRGQTVLLVGMGNIAHRLCQLLAPFELEIMGFRRTPSGDEAVPTFVLGELERHLPRADHVIDLLPGSASTSRFFNAARFALMKPGALFANIGRGTTVDQEALIHALHDRPLGAAYLDVTDPEPLPPEHPLWTTPRCYITPHSAGGHGDEPDRLLAHFLANFARWGRGESLRDRIL